MDGRIYKKHVDMSNSFQMRTWDMALKVRFQWHLELTDDVIYRENIDISKFILNELLKPMYYVLVAH